MILEQKNIIKKCNAPVEAGNEVGIAIYARSASGDSGQIENQVICCKNFIKSIGLNPDKAVIYADNGFSGCNITRPAFQKLLDDAQSGEIQVLVVHKLKNFMRNINLCVQNLEKIVQDFHITTHFVGDYLTFETDVEKSIHFDLFSRFADYYAENLDDEPQMGKLINVEEVENKPVL